MRRQLLSEFGHYSAINELFVNARNEHAEVIQTGGNESVNTFFLFKLCSGDGFYSELTGPKGCFLTSGSKLRSESVTKTKNSNGWSNFSRKWKNFIPNDHYDCI